MGEEARRLKPMPFYTAQGEVARLAGCSRQRLITWLARAFSHKLPHTAKRLLLWFVQFHSTPSIYVLFIRSRRLAHSQIPVAQQAHLFRRIAFRDHAIDKILVLALFFS